MKIITVVCDGWGILQWRIEKLNFLIPAITGVSSPNCGGKIEVRLLFMALVGMPRSYGPNPVLNKTIKGSPKQRLKKVTIIAWTLYIGSIPIYDYSLGVRVHPPLYI